MEKWFEDSYKVRLVLEDEFGDRYVENHPEMSLSDFEVLYGNIVDKIVRVDIRLSEK